ncbi:MAG: hypothetical protein GVY36_18975 [Verrucomicrobia bacterium]|jgi:hypothetical protein|nr:hypothetical protein [Verrucomicrobiota bacterium]
MFGAPVAMFSYTTLSQIALHVGREMNLDLIANVRTDADLHSWNVGKKLLSPLFAVEKLKPQRVNTFGDVTPKNGFDVEKLEDCKSYWGTVASMRVEGTSREFFEDFNWKRTRVARSEGKIDFPSNSTKGRSISGGIFFQANYNPSVNWVELFTAWCRQTSAYAGILHVATDHERQVLRDKTTRELTTIEEIEKMAWSRFAHGSFSCEFRAGDLNSLVKGLTNLGWASWFGGALIKEVDEVAISAAGFPIDKFDTGYLIRVTEQLEDVTNDFEFFSMRRMELKSLFRKELFLIKKEPKIT